MTRYLPNAATGDLLVPPTAPPFRIVAAATEHRVAMIEIVRSATAEFGIEFDPTGFDRNVLEFGDGGANKVAELALIDLDGRLRGGISAFHDGANTACLKAFYIAQDFRGRKAGHALLAAALRICADAKIKRVELTTWQRMEAAIMLYKRFGFELTAMLDPSEGSDSLYTLSLDDRTMPSRSELITALAGRK